MRKEPMVKRTDWEEIFRSATKDLNGFYITLDRITGKNQKKELARGIFLELIRTRGASIEAAKVIATCSEVKYIEPANTYAVVLKALNSRFAAFSSSSIVKKQFRAATKRLEIVEQMLYETVESSAGIDEDEDWYEFERNAHEFAVVYLNHEYLLGQLNDLELQENDRLEYGMSFESLKEKFLERLEVFQKLPGFINNMRKGVLVLEAHPWLK